MQWLYDTKSVKDTHKFLIQSDKKWEQGTAYEYCIVLDDIVIGSCGAIDVDTINKKVALGYCWRTIIVVMVMLWKLFVFWKKNCSKMALIKL